MNLILSIFGSVKCNFFNHTPAIRYLVYLYTPKMFKKTYSRYLTKEKMENILYNLEIGISDYVSVCLGLVQCKYCTKCFSSYEYIAFSTVYGYHFNKKMLSDMKKYEHCLQAEGYFTDRATIEQLCQKYGWSLTKPLTPMERSTP